MDENSQKRILQELQNQTTPAATIRLLRHAVPRVSDENKRKSLLQEALLHDDESVALEALGEIERQFPGESSSIILQAMPTCSPHVQAEICSSLARVSDAAWMPHLMRIAGQWKEAAGDKDALLLTERACHALGNFGSSEVIHQLSALLKPPSKLPWRKNPPLRLRKAALVGLERIGGDEVRSLLTPYKTDKEPLIRHRVNRILKSTKPEA